MNETRNRSSLVWGAVLIALGLLFLAGQIFNFVNIGSLWPFIVIGAGAIFFVAMVLGGKSAGGLAVPGSIISTVGLILLVQNIFGIYETWAYAWALIIAAVGAGQVIQGSWSDLPDVRKRGWETVRGGLTAFIVFAILMEFIFSVTGVSGRSLSIVLPLLLVALGLGQLVYRLYKIAKSDPQTQDLFGPIFLMSVGAVVTLGVQGIIPNDRLLPLLNLWPVLLIAAGVQMILGRRSAWVSAAMGVLVAAAIFAGALYGPQLGLNRFPGIIRIGGIDNQLIGEVVTGSGVASEENRAVGSFERVSLEGIGRLEIVQGSAPSLTITADDNLLQYITTEVRFGELVIGVKRGFNPQPKTDIIYRLTVVELSAINVSGLAEVNAGSLTTGDLRLNSSGSGNFKIENLKADDLRIEISGAGQMTIAGEAASINAAISGAGGLQAANLRANDVRVEISGLGNVTVWAIEDLRVDLSGAGSVSYYGSPNVRQEINGLGGVKALGDK